MIRRCSLLTLDLKNADSYREDFYAFLESMSWNKRQEADTAWTRILAVSDASASRIAEELSADWSQSFRSYIRDNNVFPSRMEVKGIMQIGERGYFSVRFIRNPTTGIKVVISPVQ